MTVSQKIGLPVYGYTWSTIRGFVTSLAPADLGGKRLSNDTLFHFYTNALVLLPPRSPSMPFARRRPHSTSCCAIA